MPGSSERGRLAQRVAQLEQHNIVARYRLETLQRRLAAIEDVLQIVGDANKAHDVRPNVPTFKHANVAIGKRR